MSNAPSNTATPVNAQNANAQNTKILAKDIHAKWDKISDVEASGMKQTSDLVSQVQVGPHALLERLHRAGEGVRTLLRVKSPEGKRDEDAGEHDPLQMNAHVPSSENRTDSERQLMALAAPAPVETRQ